MFKYVQKKLTPCFGWSFHAKSRIAHNPIETGRPHSNSPQDGVLQLQPKRRHGCRFSRFCRLDKNGTSAEFIGYWIRMNSLESVPIKIDGFPRIVPWFSQGSPMDFALNQFCVEKHSFRWRYLLTWTWIRPKSAKGKHWSIDLPALDGLNRFEMVLIKYKWFY